MTDWKTRLREADSCRPSGMDDADARRVREVVLAAVRQASPEVRPDWRRPLALLAAMLIVVVAGITASWQAGVRTTLGRGTASTGTEPAADDAPLPHEADPEVERQQLHFAAPGGTRIIWVFDSKFDVKGTLP
jgi:hypothetical protein